MQAGARLGHYQIAGALGKGGMGEVYLAEDTRLDRRVALKILPAAFAADGDRLARFIREAKAASALNHPNIITIYDIGEAAGTHFIAYEFVDGQTLREIGSGYPPSIASVLDIGIQIATALVEAHRAGIIHRDLGDDLIAEPIAALYDWAQGNPAPAATGDPFACEILDIKVTGRVATATVRESDAHDTVIDYFHLLKIGNEWSIVSKLWDAE